MKKIPAVHPGEILLEEFLRPMKISQNKLGRDYFALLKDPQGDVLSLLQSEALLLQRMILFICEFRVCT